MIWLLPMFVVYIVVQIIHVPLALLTAPVPQGLYDALDLAARVARSFDGIFPATTLLQALYVVLVVYLVRVIWTVIASIWSFIPGTSPKQPKQLRNVPGLND